MQEYFPSKKAQIYIAILVVIVVGVFVVDKVQRDQGKEGILSVITGSRNIDRDEDGLADWEEELWLTSPIITDTDRDGTNDGDEIAMGRHPRIPAPNDELYEGEKERIYSKAETIRQESVSANVLTESRYNTLQIAYRRLEGGESDIDAGLVLAPLATQAQSVEIPEYTLNDLKIESTVTKDGVISYTEAVVKTLLDTAQETKLGELESVILIRYFNEGREVDLSVLSQYSIEYQTIVERLLKIKVPRSFASLHLSTLNSLVTMAETLSILANYTDDPVKGFIAYDKYRLASQKVNEDVSNLGEAIVVYLNNQN